MCHHHFQSLSPSEAQPSTSTGGVTMSQPQGSPDKSPKVRKVSRINRTPEKGAFPSHHSFMSTTDVSSPSCAARATQTRETMTTEDLQRSAPSQARDGARRCRRLKLNVPCPGGMDSLILQPQKGCLISFIIYMILLCPPKEGQGISGVKGFR